MKKPRKRIKAKSDSLHAHARRELYEEAKKLFLMGLKDCERCGWHYGTALELHHANGRTGTLLIDARFFNALCSDCHNIVHTDVKVSKNEGWLGGAGQWDCPPKDGETLRLKGMIIDRMNEIGERIKAKAQRKLNSEKDNQRKKKHGT